MSEKPSKTGKKKVGLPGIEQISLVHRNIADKKIYTVDPLKITGRLYEDVQTHRWSTEELVTKQSRSMSDTLENVCRKRLWIPIYNYLY